MTKRIVSVVLVVLVGIAIFLTGIELGRDSLSCKITVPPVSVTDEATRSYGAIFNFRDELAHSEASLVLGIERKGEAYHDQELTVNQQVVFWKAGNKEWYAQGWNSERKESCNLTILAVTVNGNISGKNLIAKNC